MLLEALNEDGVAYLCDVEPATALDWLDDLTMPSEDQLEVLVFVASLAKACLQSVPAGGDQTALMRSLLVHRLLEIPKPGPESVAAACRTRVGAQPVLPASNDPLTYMLQTVAADVLLAFLTPTDPDEMRWGRHVPAITRHPLHGRATEIAFNDPDLQPLFWSGRGCTGDSFVRTNAGVGGVFQLSLFPEFVIQEAVARAERAGRLTPEVALSEVQRGLELQRSLVSGEKVSTDAYLGFDGFELPKGVHVATELGIWRNPTERERRLHGRETSIVLDTPFDLQHSVGSGIDSVHRELQLPELEDLEMRRELAGLALLCVADGEGARVQPTWVEVATLTQAKGALLPHTPGGPHGGPRTSIPRTRLGDLAIWSRRVAEPERPYLRIAIQRLQRASVQTLGPLEGLIDAVIAWENMFGASEAGVVLRVAGSVARLLGHDESSRSRLYDEAKALYQQRSKIVHGAEPRKRDYGRDHARATKLGVDAMKCLLRSRPELLRKDSADRSKAILLR